MSEAAAAHAHPAVLFAPDPGAAPLGRMITAQATLETRTLLRNGEQLLLTLIIPLLLAARKPLVRGACDRSEPHQVK